MSNTTTRLITLIMLLQRRPNQSASSLARELGVSVRTIQRYVAMLEEMGIPIYAEHGPHGGYALVRGYKMPPLVFTPEEAVAINLGTRLLEKVWGDLYQEAARGALAKLENVLPDEQRREVDWARQALTASMPLWVDLRSAGHLEILRDAVRERRQVRLVYRGQGQAQASQRDFDPYVLVHSWGFLYCIGYCRLRQGIRSFRVDRIIDVTLLDETFDELTGFDLQAYLKSEPFFRPSIRAKIYFAPQVASVALDHRVHWESMEERADGSVITTFLAHSLETAVRTFLSYGYPGEVIEPVELRQQLRERAFAIAAQYSTANESISANQSVNSEGDRV
jgi:predicted DNA-binding transcriptional regulator YafY